MRGSDRPLIRVTLVGPSLDILGGQAVQLERLVHRLEGSSDLRIDFLAVNPRLPKPFCHLQRIKYLRTIVTSLSYFLSLVRRIPQTDVVHAYSASYWSYVLAPLPAMLLGRIARKRVILNYHRGEAEDHLAKWRLSRLTMALAHEIVVPSEYLVQVFRRHGYQARAVGNFVDLDRIPYRPRAALGPAFLSNRNLEPLYNVACTLRAFGRIQEAWANATLIVAGDGSQRASLEEQARQMALRGVQFVGALAPERMSELYDRADIYLNASNIDNVPLSLLEAAAAGLR